ncbi:MAG: hypothetical protein QG614_54 [Patescibacteria group bacterium]|nr:hypothetical protein [Patescibacteria group bacterium]
MKIFNFKNRTILNFFFIFVVISFALTPKSFGAASGSTVFSIELPGPQLVNVIKTSIEQSINTAQSITSAYSDTWFMGKEVFLDKLAYYQAKLMVEKIKRDTLSWINSGFNGKPMFLQNPEQFFGNIVTDQLFLVKNKMISDLNGMNRQITQQLIMNVANQKNQFSQNMQYSIADGLCPSLKRDLIRYQSLQPSPSRDQLINEKNAQINSVCNGNRDVRDVNAKACAGDFNCGGWDAIMIKTSNLDLNTDAGKLILAQQEVDRNIQAQKDFFNSELNRGDGVFGKYECANPVKLDNGKEACPAGGYKIVTPSSVTQSQLKQVTQDPINSLNGVHEFGEDFITQAMFSFSNMLINKGLNYVTGAINSGINSVSNGLQSAINDLANGGSGSGSGQGSNVNTGLVTLSDTNIYKISDDDKNSFITVINPQYDFINKNSVEIFFVINKERAAYQKVKVALDEVAMCYKDKATQYPALVSYPGSIPQNIKDRAAEVNSKIDALNQAYDQAVADQKNAGDLYTKLQATTDFREMKDLQAKFAEVYRAAVNNASYWQVREAQNNAGGGDVMYTTGGGKSIYKVLDEEIESLAGTLAQCQAIGGSTNGTPYSNF